MTAHLSVSARPIELHQLRLRIVNAYQHAHDIIVRAGSAPPAKIHVLMSAYNKVCDDMRDDIAQACGSFANTDQLQAWLLDDDADGGMPEADRMGLALAARAIAEDIGKTRKGP